MTRTTGAQTGPAAAGPDAGAAAAAAATGTVSLTPLPAPPAATAPSMALEGPEPVKVIQAPKPTKATTVADPAPMPHGKQWTDATGVADLGGGWFLSRQNDGQVQMAIYSSSDPHNGEQPTFQRTIPADAWDRAVAATRKGVKGKLRPGAKPIKTGKAPKEPKRKKATSKETARSRNEQARLRTRKTTRQTGLTENNHD